MKLSRKIGFALSGIHLLVFFLFLLYLDRAEGGQGGMAGLLWGLWFPFDFPVSYALVIGLAIIPDTLPLGEFLRTWLPHIVQGVFGTFWWFYVPIVVAMFFSWLGKKARSAKDAP